MPGIIEFKGLQLRLQASSCGCRPAAHGSPRHTEQTDVSCRGHHSAHTLQGVKHKRWFLDSLAEVHHTRFLLQPAALEVFVHDRSNALLSFPSHQVCSSSEF